MTDQQNIDAEVSFPTSIDQKPPLLKTNISIVNHMESVLNDELAESTSVQAHIKNYKSRYRNLVTQFTDSVAKSANNLKNYGTNLPKIFTNSKFTEELTQAATTESISKTNIKGFFPSSVLSVILSIASFALFLVYINETPEDPEKLANSIDAETVYEIAANHEVTNQEVQAYISDLLVIAKQQIQNKNLTLPANNNAHETYQQIL